MKTLTANQIAWLEAIAAAGSAGVSSAQVLDLKGRARSYEARYRRSLEAAIDAHNDRRAANSPIPSSDRVVIGPFGPQGGRRYRVEYEPIVEVAREVVANEHQHPNRRGA
jgi:hypothetical protein